MGKRKEVKKPGGFSTISSRYSPYPFWIMM
jgi:hypothetical protein